MKLSLPFAWTLAIAIALWMALTAPVVPQEAYYWSYAQHPALSYFDHPPMVAWGITAGTFVFGDGAAGIRAVTLLLAWGTTWIGQLLLARFGASTEARALWVVLSLGVPMFAAGHFLATPDAPLLFFWTAMVYALWRARDGSSIWWVLVGLAGGGTLLSKYTASFAALGAGLVLVLDRRMRSQLLTPGPWLAALIAAACFLPVVIWNAQHDWASFLFQSSNRYKGSAASLKRATTWIGVQFLVAAPVVALLLPFVVAWLARGLRRIESRAIWLASFGLPLPIFVASNSPYMTAKPNWTTPALLFLVMAFVLWIVEKDVRTRWPRLAKAGAATIAVTIVALLATPLLDYVKQGRGGTWSGWDRIARRSEAVARDLGCDTGPAFVFGADYKDAAQLALHRHWLDLPPRVVLAQNVRGEPGLAFDYWVRPETQIGCNGVFVLTRPEQRKKEVTALRRVFASIERVERIDIERLSWVVLAAEVYACRGYRGPHVD